MLRSLGFAVLIVVMLIVGLLVLATVQGHVAWLVWSPSRVTVNGKPNGYVHTCAARSFLILTRTDGKQHQSYLISWRDRRRLIHCGDWVAPRFPLFPMGGDINPPCSGLAYTWEVNPRDEVADVPFLVRDGFVQFLTEGGNKIEANW